MQLAIELDHVLVDVKATELMWVGPWFDDDCDDEERAMLPDLADAMWRDAVPVTGVFGTLTRAAQADTRLQVKVLSDRPERFQPDTRAWLKRWMPLNVTWELYNTSYFPRIPAQVYVVHSEGHTIVLEEQGAKVVDTLEKAGLPMPDRSMPL